MNQVHTAVVALVLAFAAPAAARIQNGYTPEWMAHDASLVVEAIPLDVSVSFYAGDTWFTQVRLRLANVIKGPLREGDEVTIWDYYGKDPFDFKGAIPAKRKVLIFAKVAENTFREMDGKYVFIHYSSKQATFFADAKVKNVYSEEGSRIEDYNLLVSCAAKQVAKESELRRNHWKGTITMKPIKAQSPSDAFGDLYNGSAVYVITPDYQQP